MPSTSYFPSLHSLASQSKVFVSLLINLALLSLHEQTIVYMNQHLKHFHLSLSIPITHGGEFVKSYEHVPENPSQPSKSAKVPHRTEREISLCMTLSIRVDHRSLYKYQGVDCMTTPFTHQTNTAKPQQGRVSATKIKRWHGDGDGDAPNAEIQPNERAGEQRTQSTDAPGG